MNNIMSLILDNIVRTDNQIRVYKDHLGRHLCYYKYSRLATISKDTLFLCIYSDGGVTFADYFPIYRSSEVNLKDPDSVRLIETTIQDQIKFIKGCHSVAR